MTSMVERVAKELAECRWDQLGIPECDRPEWADQTRGFGLKQARAAIAAMREPTEAMEEAALDVRPLMLPDSPREVWEAMIDAALNEEGQG